MFNFLGNGLYLTAEWFSFPYFHINDKKAEQAIFLSFWKTGRVDNGDIERKMNVFIIAL